MNFTVFDQNGKIVTSGFCADDDYWLQVVPEGCKILPIESNCLTQYIDEDRVVDIPESPSLHHIFDYTTKQWIDHRTPETEWPLVRIVRDKRLQATDWTQLPDVPIATKETWAAYRQALRDITLQPDPFNIVWPQPPQ